jgi:hypothetical protein
MLSLLPRLKLKLRPNRRSLLRLKPKLNPPLKIRLRRKFKPNQLINSKVRSNLRISTNNQLILTRPYPREPKISVKTAKPMTM